ALVSGLENQRGGVALVPLEDVDFRVNVLAVDGFDPLRDQESPAAPLIRIAVVGDIVPGRNVERKMRAFNDYTRPFTKIAPVLSSYDLTIANLEGNLSAEIPPPDDPNTFSFIADPAMIEGFRLGGIDAVTVANNHSVFNSAGWGVEAFIDTIEALEAASFPYFGGGRDLEAARQPYVATVRDRTIAWLGIDGVTGNAEQTAGVVTSESGAGVSSPGTNPFVTDQFLADIATAAGQYNIVIPYFHMGVEYLGVPPSWAIEAAHGAIDAGATMVVTNHPHVIQGMEIYGGKPIVYSVGNFVFDQMFSVDTRQGLILEITLQGSRVVGIRTRGIEVEDFHQPRLMSGGEQAAIMDRFWRSTDRTAAGVAF
ncbi:MAG: CapA family protein, partial [Chloroflexota bacterium]|nr:CapA family protein [Chloroflexota bacterium]